MIKLTFTDFNGDNPQRVEAEEGMTILEVAHANGIDMEGTCEGNMACSTCHVIVDPLSFSNLPAPSEEEDEMLDLAPDLSSTSRLGCQITLTKTIDGMVMRLPRATLNAGGW